ncbi:MAG: CHASE2 domain-containing protein [Cyanobacteria bacterium P01_A01_bin.114]
MSNLVILNLGRGTLQAGFPDVTAQIWLENQTAPVSKVVGALPASPELQALYLRWHLLYEHLHQIFNWTDSPRSWRIQLENEEILQFSEQDFNNLCEKFETCLNQWLSSDSFSKVKDELFQVFSRDSEIRFFLETDELLVRRLPWQRWQFFRQYPRADIALSPRTYSTLNPVQSRYGKVRILAILGDDTGIDLGKDRTTLEQGLPHTELVWLVQPNRQQFNDLLWDREGWDLLLFAGHSKTEGESGRIYLNPQESLSLSELNHGLSHLATRGLQLAILNSCDGLGLIHALETLNIPHIIGMREPVVDCVAHEFLRCFLRAFSTGQALHLAIRHAREQLQGIEDRFPCASWLPVLLCQNPLVSSLTWETLIGPAPAASTPPASSSPPSLLSGPTESEPSIGIPKPPWRKTLLLSTVIASCVIWGRSLSLLQPFELLAFDHFMRLRPAEKADDRFLIVTVSNADIQAQDAAGMERRGSLADEALATLLQKLEPHTPTVIVLDIYHPFEYEETLASKLQETAHFIAPCEVAQTPTKPDSVPGPPGFPPDRLGFTDWPRDPDDVVRRQLLGMSPSSECQTSQSLSLRVALDYLDRMGMPQLELNDDGDRQIGNVVLKRLTLNAGGYELPPSETRGYQILLNYRTANPPSVSLTEVLNGSLDTRLKELVEDRIILIGVEALKDVHLTPYRQRAWPDEVSGVYIHAQMASQLISAVMEGRPLLWWLPQWGECVWIAGWSWVGGFIVCIFRTQSSWQIGLSGGILLGVLYGSCYVLFLQGGWVPLVPSAAALVLSICGTLVASGRTAVKAL